MLNIIRFGAAVLEKKIF